MLHRSISIGLLAIASFAAKCQVDLSYYLPEGISYSSEIPTPASVIGHEVGEYHVTHDKLVYYMKAVAAASDRVSVEQFGTTHEKRPQLLLTITSPKNHANIDQLKADHKKLTDPSASGSLDLSQMPAVVLQGYSIHGNESSGSNASLVAVYHYAAAQGPEIEKLLENVIILVDPSFNPDGLTRFSSWANSRRSKNLVADPNNQEQNEYWPGGRTNHYWFDLNRDWLPVQQPEAYNRIVKFHEWKPNILTDHHEMGTSSTFFFQPGIPARNNPNTPKENFNLTSEIGNYHAKALDDIGSLYFTKESYDDFYYGKGSTFPDINGGIGILFEQASSRGHAQESQHGVVTFPFTIKNQFTTSISTVDAALNMREKLLDYQRRFFKEAQMEASKNPNKGIIFGSENDASRSAALARILATHEIEVKEVTKDTRVNGTTYRSGKSYFVPMNQAQYRLINIMFEEVTSFQDSLFYDVSAWTLPHAFNLSFDYLTAKTISSVSAGESYDGSKKNLGKLALSEYAYAFEWDDYQAPALLNKLLQAGILCKVANMPFVAEGKRFDRGSIMIATELQEESADELRMLLNKLQSSYGIQIHSLPTGLTQGVNLGSRTLSKVASPSIALLVEGGTRSYDAGEIWHLLDNRFDIEVSLVPTRRLGRVDLSRYNTMIWVDGNYGSLSGSADKIKEWIKKGGTLIAYKAANRWLKQQEIADVSFVDTKKQAGGPLTYADQRNASGARLTAGTIFQGNLDLTHPLAYGYNKEKLPVFIDENLFFETPKNPYSYPFSLDSSKPLLSGYVHRDNLELLKGTPGIIVSRYGTGRIISFSFNTNFRAFWYGTNKLLLNAIFFGDQISGSSANE